ncbi:MAG: hypothetical protein U5J98_02580 [Halobacteriales archaeon]|nr:hypothetical protein [Halobacteriales archaeon]
MPVSTALLAEVAVGIVALYTLITAAGTVVDRSLSLAQHYGVPEILIGMTVLAIGTSLPELSSHVIASLGIASGALDREIGSALVLGGNMGSSTLQQTLLLGLLVVGYGRLEFSRSFERASYLPMLLALALTLAVAVDGTVSRLDGVVLLVAYGAYLYYSYHRRERAPSLPGAASTNVRRDAAVAAGGLVLVLLAATLLLAVAQLVVEALALGGSMIGVVTIGMAAALPELSTVLDAIRRRAPNVALGTLVGSNVVNPLLGIGLGGAISTYTVPQPVIVWDLPFKLLVGVGLWAFVRYRSDGVVTRRAGATLVVLYFVFISVRLVLFPAQ